MPGCAAASTAVSPLPAMTVTVDVAWRSMVALVVILVAAVTRMVNAPTESMPVVLLDCIASAPLVLTKPSLAVAM